MAKVPGPYLPLSGGNGEGRSVNDPPPYSELDPTNSDGPVAATIASPAAQFILPSNYSSGLGLANNRTRGSVINGQSDENNDSIPAIVTRGIPLASKSIDVVCPHCQTEIRTSIEKRPGLLAYLSGAVMACLCCFCGCCLIPCCIEECMEVKHTCPNCDGLIGKYRL